MGCQNDVVTGDNLTFSITCHNPDTGILTDADSVPAYRVYEDETATAILTGTMAKLDDSNTTGFYTEQIACTTANGFENGKSYTIYITATVGSDKGGISFGFSAHTHIWTRTPRTLTASAASTTATVSGSDITITRGDDATIVLTDLGDISARSKLWFTLKIKRSDSDDDAIIQITDTDGMVRLNGTAWGSGDGSIVVDNATNGDITITIDSAATVNLAIRNALVYDVQMLNTSGSVSTLTSANCQISADVTRSLS